jgi:hypothetical protein
MTPLTATWANEGKRSNRASVTDIKPGPVFPDIVGSLP